MTPSEKREVQSRLRRMFWLVIIAFVIGTLGGFTLGQYFPHEQPCTTADCVRQSYGYYDSLDVSDYSRSRWIYTNRTMLHAMQFHRGGFHFTYIDQDHSEMISIDAYNGTRTGDRVEVRISDRQCFDEHERDLYFTGCTTTYTGNLTKEERS